MMKLYGLPFFIWYSTLYVGMGAGFYVSISQGYVGGGDILEFVTSLGLDQYIDTTRLNSHYANLMGAFVLNELAEVVRMPLCIATTPMIAKYVRSKK